MVRIGAKTLTPSEQNPSFANITGWALWILWAGLFILRSPNGAFTHDIQGHLQHTRILYNEHRLPLPHEGSETYGPPLYYFLNTLLSPNRPVHMMYVRLMSVLYGGLSLWLMRVMLARYRAAPSTSAIVLGFIATTPAFLFMFTTYNNDSLATLFSMGILVSVDDWIRNRRRRSLLLLALLGAAGLYTKMSVLFTLGALLSLFVFLGLSRKMAWNRIVPAAKALIISGLVFTPWLLGHNYRLTGQLTPAPADQPVTDQIRLPHSAFRTFLTPPGWTPGEWKDPYVHVWDADHHKKNSFWAYVFVTSIFGEFTFEFLPPAIPWGILILHAVLWIAVVFHARKSPDGLAALSLVFLGAVFMSSLIFRSSYYAALMDFRYIGWTWMPTSVLYAAFRASPSSRSFSSAGVFTTMMVSGIVLQGVLWLSLISGGRWNIPN